MKNKKNKTVFIVIVIILALIGIAFWYGGTDNPIPLLRSDRDTLFTPEGDIREIRGFKNGRLSGKVVRYTEGFVNEISHYKEGKLDGEQTLYFKNSLVEAERSYKKGVLHGLARKYNHNGNVTEETFYESGMPNGEMVTYYLNGAVHERFTMVKGIKNGSFEEFSEIGEVIALGTYRNGIRIKKNRAAPSADSSVLPAPAETSPEQDVKDVAEDTFPMNDSSF